MKFGLVFLICFFQQMHSNAANLLLNGNFGPKLECITLIQAYTATKNLCSQRNNTYLWGKIIECHRPISDEFMRASGEAQCPMPSNVQNPNNTCNSMEDVFLNVCGLFNANFWQVLKAGFCLVGGQSNPYIMGHVEEVARVKATWGEKVPCSIGQCVLKYSKELGLA